MTAIDLSEYHARGTGPARDVMQRCCRSKRKGTLYMQNKSVLMLRDDDSRTWYFYNDNSDMNVRVVAHFRLCGERVRAMQTTYRSVFALPIECPPGADTVVTEVGVPHPAAALPKNGAPRHVYVRALVTVPALETRPFVSYDKKSDVADAVLDFSCEASGLAPASVSFQGGLASGSMSSSVIRDAPNVGKRVEGPDPRMLRGCSRIYPCFRSPKPGGAEMLYRLVSIRPSALAGQRQERWAFYNDSADYNITVRAVFEDAAEVTTLGNTRRLESAPPLVQQVPTTGDNGASKMIVVGTDTNLTDGDADDDNAWMDSIHSQRRPVTFLLSVPPLSTELFMEGLPSTYSELAYSAHAVSNEEPERYEVTFSGAGPDLGVIAYDQLYRCYPDRGNGLLFRLVDTAGKRWAFYNDTANQFFTVTLEMSSTDGADAAADPTPAILPGPAVECAAGEGRAPLTLRLLVPPRETRLLLCGALPLRYRLHYDTQRLGAGLLAYRGSPTYVEEAESVEVDACNFAMGGPDRSRFPFTSVYRTPAADVYRLVSASGCEWAFYNDAARSRAFLAVRFDGAGAGQGEEDDPHIEAAGSALLVRVRRAGSSRPGNEAVSPFAAPLPGGLVHGPATLTEPLCPEVLLTVGPGETLPCVRARRPLAQQCYELFIRGHPGPNAEVEGGGAAMGFTYADAAAVMRTVARPERVWPCFHGNHHRTLLYHLEQTIPSPTLAAAQARAAGCEGGAAAFATPAAVPVLSEAEEEAVLRGRPVRWSLFNDTRTHCFVVTYRLDPRSRTRALGATRRRGRVGLPRCTSTAAASGTSAARTPRARGINGGAPGRVCCSTPLPSAGPALSLPSPQSRSPSSPLERSGEEVCLNEWGEAAPVEQGRDGEVVYTVVVDPLCTVPVLEGDVVSVVNFLARVDEPRENGLITFNNGQPRIFASEAAFVEQSRAAVERSSVTSTPRTVASSAVSGSPMGAYLDNMLECPHLRFYRLMPTRFNGLLFRIVDDVSGLWSYYNDTTTYRFTVRVLFTRGSTVRAAGNARDVTERERKAARRLGNGSAAAAAARKSPLANSISACSTADAAGFSFFSDRATSDDVTARVLEVDVGPEQTELLALAEDVVRFRTAWFATPVVSEDTPRG